MRTAFAIYAAALLAAAPAPERAAAQTLKEEALEQFDLHDYPGAIETLQRALKKDSTDAEIYYYLGYFTHYLCYDSVPLPGFGRAKSDEVLEYLGRALEIDSGLGNARYFIGAEYGARARQEMQDGNPRGIAEQFRLGRKAGGYPDWLIEFARNTLRSCETGAILFTGGDGDTNPAQYLQYVEGFRNDVTVIPLPLLDRPWLVSILKHGGKGIIGTAPVSWSDAQIQSMHPYKWKTNTISIPVSKEAGSRYGIEADHVDWELAPDLSDAGGSERLSAGRAVFADILVTNAFRRPVYFSMGCSGGVFEGLREHVQLRGFAQRLVPSVPGSSVDRKATEALLLDEGGYESLPTVADSDMPRISGMLRNYRIAFLNLIYSYIQAGDEGEAVSAFRTMQKLVPAGALPVSEGVKGHIEALTARFKGK